MAELATATSQGADQQESSYYKPPEVVKLPQGGDKFCATGKTLAINLVTGTRLMIKGLTLSLTAKCCVCSILRDFCKRDITASGVDHELGRLIINLLVFNTKVWRLA